ncbi:hypothetical protein [Novispirillum itersonii]|uniref:hypothetical protein n=1 Tax=Novispirillum itersonii TaxID=189 RepID=UPI0012DC8370|nr:hypothetical protein [Novispirillum itersonii]
MIWGLSELVRAAGEALCAEDVAFRTALRSNRDCPGQFGGILRMANERYFQFVIARFYAGILPYVVKVEDNRRDISLSLPGRREPDPREIVIEMKCWLSASGNSELAAIRTDMFQNLTADIAGSRTGGFRARQGLMLIVSANPRGQMTSNVRWLSDRLGVSADDWETFVFDTENADGAEVEFWVAGYDVSKAGLQSPALRVE